MNRDIRVLIGSGADEIIRKKCIAAGDIKKAVISAERDRLYFEDGHGARTCALRLENLTYWVSYVPDVGGTFEVRNAYFHRMKFEET